MPKTPHCDRSSSNSQPESVDGEVCLDLQRSPVTYETNHVPTLTRSQQYQILMTDPMFTGLCPQCRYEYRGWNQNSWDCYACGWEAIGLSEK
jgi:hypothetical protein